MAAANRTYKPWRISGWRPIHRPCALRIRPTPRCSPMMRRTGKSCGRAEILSLRSFTSARSRLRMDECIWARSMAHSTRSGFRGTNADDEDYSYEEASIDRCGMRLGGDGADRQDPGLGELLRG